jgi:Fe-Mn family superoxide dismutase
MFKLPELPYSTSALAPWLSPESFEYHYGKHHKTYIDKLNSAIEGTEDQKASLEDLVLKTKGGLFNNAAQSWNHTFFWYCISDKNNDISKFPEVQNALSKSFGSFDEFKAQFSNTAVAQFGSGWAWLVKDKSGKLEIVSTSNAETPITQGKIPLLTCDVWEHAYYIDHRNARPKFVEGFLSRVNWQFVESNLKSDKTPDMTKLMR